MPTEFFKFKFSLLSGDLIYALAGIQEVCQRYNTKAILYLGLNVEWQMSDELKEGRKNQYTLTEDTMKMLKPLLESQPYIHSVESWADAQPEEYAAWGEFFKTPKTQDEILRWYQTNMREVIDLDKQHVMPINIPQGNIARWNFYIFPDMACDLSKPWLHVETNDTFPPQTILINLTARYRNKTISYEFLKSLEKRLLFAGTKEEWNEFRLEHHINLPHLLCNNFLELACAIKSCSFFIGNQSLCFALAEALKVPRILEISRDIPNVIPCGEKAYDFYFQSCLEHYVRDLSKYIPK